jgi:hypothetical protein
MTGGMGGKGFLGGAVVGLALALLLVGVASFVPQSNSALKTGSTPANGAAQVVAASMSTTNVVTTTSTCFAAQPQAGSCVSSPTPPLPSPSAGSSSAPSQSTTSKTQQQRPGSLLTILPGEGIGGLLATISPLLVGLLVAALVYGAYTRRQDSPS